MKKIILFSIPITAVVLMSFLLMPTDNFQNENATTISEDIILNVEMPENVKAIVDNKCYGCHNTESKNEKGAKKLSFDKLSDLKKVKQIAKLDEIHETVVEAKMPPKKFLAKYPDKALTDEEKEILTSWAKSESEKLMK